MCVADADDGRNTKQHLVLSAALALPLRRELIRPIARPLEVSAIRPGLARAPPPAGTRRSTFLGSGPPPLVQASHGSLWRQSGMRLPAFLKSAGQPAAAPPPEADDAPPPLLVVRLAADG